MTHPEAVVVVTMSAVDVGAARRHLAALFASAPAGSLIEVRFRSGERMYQSFHRVDALADAVAEIERHAGSTDVRRRGRTRAA